MNESMDIGEIWGVMIGMMAAALFILSAIFSLIYMFEQRGMKWRMLPCLSILTFFVIELVPESGGTNTLAQWHQAVLVLLWSIWALFLCMFFFKGEKERSGKFLRIAFGVMGLVFLFGSASGLVESWVFLHSF